MERNLDRRVEVLCPVREPELRQHLRDVVLESLLNDSHRAAVLSSDGAYTPASAPPSGAAVNSQQFLLDHYTRPSGD